MDYTNFINDYKNAMELVLKEIDIIVAGKESLIYEKQTRIKSYDSLYSKITMDGMEMTADNVKSYIHDVAGIRLITETVDDMYALLELLQKSKLNMVAIKDYVKQPKRSGYRSIHLILDVYGISVEVQVRTQAMNTYASIEHSLRYKADSVSDETNKMLEQLLDELLKKDGLQ